MIDKFHKFSKETPITYLFFLQLQKERHDICKTKFLDLFIRLKSLSKELYINRYSFDLGNSNFKQFFIDYQNQKNLFTFKQSTLDLKTN
ncbi:unnamed protein product [Paramecium pentaurelia]|uniref:Uncharacterized protein n=1 Tax=Paramecium pentaurelia TaxID=43138 RepID=A0A8S1V8E2_9CILI|nr:unnamed protein product [Paramecium pentaurelia]